MKKKISKDGDGQNSRVQDQDFESLSSFWRASYNDTATRYDTSRYGGWAGQLETQRIVELLHMLVPIDANSQILDVATGTGIAALNLAPRKGHIIGVDLSEGMMGEARRHASEKGIQNVEFSVANAKSLPFADNTFDAVVSLKFLHRIPNRFRKPLVAEMVRVPAYPLVCLSAYFPALCLGVSVV